MASSIMQNGTAPPAEQIDSKMVNAGTKNLLETTIHNLSQRLQPWDTSQETTKSSKKKVAGNIFIPAPMSHKTKNMTSRLSTSSEKKVVGGNEMTPTPNLKEKVNSLLPNEMTNVGNALPCTDRTFVSLSTRQKTMASSIMQNGTATPAEQIDSKTVNAGIKNLLKNTMHKLSRQLWPWDASQETTKSSKKKDAGNIFIPAPISHKTKNMTSSPSTSSEKNVAGGHEMTPTPNLKIFSFLELKVATRNFRPDSELGEGGFGRVFKGWLKEKHNVKLGTETVVAVKKLNPDGVQGLQEWLSEVNFVGRLSHPNLVKLLGYCSEDKELLLVYEYMRKGSLENHLFRRGSYVQPLPWDIRLKILVGAARGLTFLHTLETTVIHRDFKASNILLDESYNAKLSDFGLAKSKPMDGSSHVSTEVMGTDGYVDPEYFATGHLTVKSDVYGFGVVLVEMLTGLRAFDPNRPSGQQNLVDWIKPYLSERRKLINIMDARLEGSYPRKSCVEIAGLALNCLALDPKDRPDMTQVLDTLEKLYAARDEPRVQFRRDGNEPRRSIRARDKPRAQFRRDGNEPS